MAEILKPTPLQHALDEVERMRLETEAILAESAQLIKEVEFLLEENRRLRKANVALRADREKKKRGE